MCDECHDVSVEVEQVKAWVQRLGLRAQAQRLGLQSSSPKSKTFTLMAQISPSFNAYIIVMERL